MNHATAARRLGVKVFAQTDGDAPVELEPFIGVFQRWIQQNALDGELMIDAVDYRHVPQGPGVLLICQAAHYALDSSEGQLGLVCNAKRGEPEELVARLKLAFVRTLAAASKLEQEQQPARMRFDGQRLLLQIQDRLLAPNDDSTFEALRQPLQDIADQLYPGGGATLERASGDARHAFAVTISGNTEDPPDVSTLLARARKLPS